MNPKHKELQRRLSMTSVPKPPVGLAERIKRDIPEVMPRRRQASASWMRIAASIVLVIGATWFSVRFFTRSGTGRATYPAMVMRKKEAPVSFPAPQPQSAEAGPMSGVPLPVPPAAALEPSATSSRAAAAAVAEESRIHASAERIETAANERRDTPAAGTEVPPAEPRAIADSGASGGPLYATKTLDEAAAAPEAAAPAPSASPIVAGNVAGKVADAAAKRSAAPMMQLAAPPPPATAPFGIPSGEAAFQEVKRAIEHGERPREVDVPALINYFAGSAPTTNDPVSLEAELSKAPVTGAVPENAAVLRISIDSRHADDGAAVAHDIQLAIIPDRASVADVRSSSGTRSEWEQSGPIVLEEKSLAPGVSTTMIYRLELRQPVRRGKIAVVHLSFRDASGTAHVLTATVNGSQVDRAWTAGTRRQRLATLGALWADNLRAQLTRRGSNTVESSREGRDVVRRAEELAMQEPTDTRARELAALVTAFSRLQSSGPTGSGR